jgi:hypothetical protein
MKIYGLRYEDFGGKFISQPDYWGFFKTREGAKRASKRLTEKEGLVETDWTIVRITVKP